MLVVILVEFFDQLSVVDMFLSFSVLFDCSVRLVKSRSNHISR